MRNWNDKPLRRSRIEIIPMIDVMMFLLVFFVLISLNVTPARGLKTALPTSSQAQETHAKRNAVITLGLQGELELDGKAVTVGQLPQRLREMKRADEKLFVVVNGDKGTELQRLVDVMDAVKSAGIDALSIATKRT